MSPQSSGEKTEKATPKKKREAREKGQVFKSMDMIVAMSMLALVGTLSLFGSYMADSIQKLMIHSYTNVPDAVTMEAIVAEFNNSLMSFLTTMLPILGIAFLAALVFNYLQVGFLFTSKSMMPKFSRVSMSEGFKRIFSKRTLVELLKSVAKIAALGIIGYNEYQTQIERVPDLMVTDISSSINVVVDIVIAVCLKMAIALVVMAPFDFAFQWWKHQKDLMMTKQEVKDEYKLSEGDPQIKGKIRQKQRQMSSLRMMQAVADADVVITNPTHYSIALSYKEEIHQAPVVVAKGKDFLAKRIREKAEEIGIERVENKQLAQYLYFYCEIGDQVPEEMFQAVAEILAYIYRLKNRV